MENNTFRYTPCCILDFFNRVLLHLMVFYTYTYLSNYIRY